MPAERVVAVLPITHSTPADPELTVQIPAALKLRLRLDDDRSWVVLTEANRFIWPGPDLRPLTPGDAASVVYGPLSYALFEQIRLKFLAALRARRTRAVRRTDQRRSEPTLAWPEGPPVREAPDQLFLGVGRQRV